MTVIEPMFFKAHYEIIADAIAEEHNKGGKDAKIALETLALKFSVIFSHDNVNFDQKKFLQRCGMV
jgi:hypothetical protein